MRSYCWLICCCVLMAWSLIGIPSHAQTHRSTPQPNTATKGVLNRPMLMPQLGHSEFVTSVAFSPDGRFALTGSDDKTARLWEVATGQELRRLEGHSDWVTSVAFSPDGKFALTGSVDKTARLWDVATGRELRRLEGHSDWVTSVAFSPDGRFALTGSWDGTARVWEVATGQELRRLEGHSDWVTSVAFSPDGRFALTGSKDKTARLWDVATGRELRRFEGHSSTILSATFSPDGRFALTGSGDKTARLWDVATGRELRRLEGHSDWVTSVAFSPDGRFALTGSWDGTARVWEVATGQELRRLEGHSDWVNSVAFSPDGRFALTGSVDKTARLWDVATSRELRRFEGHSAYVQSVAFSPDGRFALTGSGDKAARLWDVATGRELRRFEGHSSSVNSVAFSPNGKFALTGSGDKTARLWDVATGRELRRFEGHSSTILSATFSPDGRFALTGSGDKTARLWEVATGEVATGQELRRLEGHSDWVNSVAFSLDGKFALTGSDDKTARLWDVATGKELRRFEGHSSAILSATFSLDGKFALTGSKDKTARLWEVATGQELRRLEGHSDWVNSVAFSLDGKFALTGSASKTVRLWDVATGRELRRFEGHFGWVTSVAFSPDGRFALTGSWDGTARLWEVATGQELCSLISFRDGTWAVTDPAGRYDASNGGDVEGLHWVVGMEAISLKQLKTRYYDPGLLAKYVNAAGKTRDVSAFTHVDLTPDVQATAPPAGSARLSIALANRGGGLGAVQVLVNGKEVSGDARGPHPDPDAAKANITLDLAHVPGLRVGQPNEILVYARNGAGYLQSRGVRLVWTPPGPAAPTVQPELYAIVAGIGDYGNPNLHLRLPPRDAAQMANALRLGAARLFGAERAHITLLSSDSKQAGAMPPTKENFRKAFADLARRARPDDIVVVYFAGHGAAIQDKAAQDTYCYLTQDARSFDLSDPQVRTACSVSSEELADWTKAIPALKQVLILDTCAAGTAGRRLMEKRAVPGEQVRAIDRLKDRTGFYVLMGCAADAVSYEASQYGQGLLTYALLQGMQGAKLRDGEFVDVSPLFEYAADVVPTLAEGIGGIQRPQIIAPTPRDTPKGKQAASFDIGRLQTPDKQAIVLPQPRLRLLRPTFLNPARARDDLNLSGLVRLRLRASSETNARGQAPLYLDVEPDDLPSGIVPSGTYAVMGDTITARIVLSKDGKDIVETQATGQAADLNAFADKIAEAIQTALRNPLTAFRDRKDPDKRGPQDKSWRPAGLRARGQHLLKE